MQSISEAVVNCRLCDIPYWTVFKTLCVVFVLCIQEDELRKEGLAKHAHLNEELHVNIEVYAQATDAYQRLAHAVTEVHKYMVPVCMILSLIVEQFAIHC